MSTEPKCTKCGTLCGLSNASGTWLCSICAGEELAHLSMRVKVLQSELGDEEREHKLERDALEADLTALRAACATYREMLEEVISEMRAVAIEAAAEGVPIKGIIARIDRLQTALALTPDTLRGLTAVPENTVYLNGQVLINAAELVELREMEEYCGLLEEECSSEQLASAQKRHVAQQSNLKEMP